MSKKKLSPTVPALERERTKKAIDKAVELTYREAAHRVASKAFLWGVGAGAGFVGLVALAIAVFR
jgi:CRISPR/Cas system endoribonuclease Cas6 (RAMP superfamily)